MNELAESTKSNCIIVRSGYCLFVDAICGGSTPVERDEAGKWVLYSTAQAAEAEIIDIFEQRIVEYKEGERTFEETLVDEFYVMPVSVKSGGAVVDEAGRLHDLG
jgi:hypothetical protein